MDAVVSEIGGDRVGMRIFPFNRNMECVDSKPDLLGLYMAYALNKFNMAYVHMIKSRLMIRLGRTLNLLPMRKAFKNTFIVAGSFHESEGNKAIAEDYVDFVAFGRLFLANPDLPR